MVQFKYNNKPVLERDNNMTPQEMITKLNDAKNGIYPTAELEAIWVPNDMLPESYQDDREGGRSLDRLEEEREAREGISEHIKRKADKAENIASYRKQVEFLGEFEYNGHVDELQQHKSEIAMVTGMLNGGMVELGDLELDENA